MVPLKSRWGSSVRQASPLLLRILPLSCSCSPLQHIPSVLSFDCTAWCPCKVSVSQSVGVRISLRVCEAQSDIVLCLHTNPPPSNTGQFDIVLFHQSGGYDAAQTSRVSSVTHIVIFAHCRPFTISHQQYLTRPLISLEKHPHLLPPHHHDAAGCNISSSA